MLNPLVLLSSSQRLWQGKARTLKIRRNDHSEKNMIDEIYLSYFRASSVALVCCLVAMVYGGLLSPLGNARLDAISTRFEKFGAS
jgi:hypothetical protein